MPPDNYYERKYKLFIKTWQTSSTVEEVRQRLYERHGWYDGLDASTMAWWPKKPRLSRRTVRSYAWRLRKKGVELKQMQEDIPDPDEHRTDYGMLCEYARNVAPASTDG